MQCPSIYLEKLQRVRGGPGARPVSYPVGTGGSFHEGKAAGAWSWLLTSIYWRGRRMREAIPLLPQYVFMSWYLFKHKNNLTSRLPYPSIWYWWRVRLAKHVSG